MSIFFKIWLTSLAVLLPNLTVCALLDIYIDESVYGEILIAWSIIQGVSIIAYGLIKFIICVWSL